jgi:hypothetical protein
VWFQRESSAAGEGGFRLASRSREHARQTGRPSVDRRVSIIANTLCHGVSYLSRTFSQSKEAVLVTIRLFTSLRGVRADVSLNLRRRSTTDVKTPRTVIVPLDFGKPQVQLIQTGRVGRRRVEPYVGMFCKEPLSGVSRPPTVASRRRSQVPSHDETE